MALEFNSNAYIHYAPMRALILDETAITFCGLTAWNHNALSRTEHWFALARRDRPQCPVCRAAVMGSG